jgi:hypothetical protein
MGLGRLVPRESDAKASMTAKAEQQTVLTTICP